MMGTGGDDENKERDKEDKGENEMEEEDNPRKALFVRPLDNDKDKEKRTGEQGQQRGGQRQRKFFFICGQQ